MNWSTRLIDLTVADIWITLFTLIAVFCLTYLGFTIYLVLSEWRACRKRIRYNRGQMKRWR